MVTSITPALQHFHCRRRRYRLVFVVAVLNGRGCNVATAARFAATFPFAALPTLTLWTASSSAPVNRSKLACCRLSTVSTPCLASKVLTAAVAAAWASAVFCLAGYVLVTLSSCFVLLFICWRCCLRGAHLFDAGAELDEVGIGLHDLIGRHQRCLALQQANLRGRSRCCALATPRSSALPCSMRRWLMSNACGPMSLCCPGDMAMSW